MKPPLATLARKGASPEPSMDLGLLWELFAPGSPCELLCHKLVPLLSPEPGSSLASPPPCKAQRGCTEVVFAELGLCWSQFSPFHTGTPWNYLIPLNQHSLWQTRQGQALSAAQTQEQVKNHPALPSGGRSWKKEPKGPGTTGCQVPLRTSPRQAAAGSGEPSQVSLKAPAALLSASPTHHRTATHHFPCCPGRADPKPEHMGTATANQRPTTINNPPHTNDPPHQQRPTRNNNPLHTNNHPPETTTQQQPTTNNNQPKKTIHCTRPTSNNNPTHTNDPHANKDLPKKATQQRPTKNNDPPKPTTHQKQLPTKNNNPLHSNKDPPQTTTQQ